jgi:site-specific DNA-methyltransferase (adenine-specific)
MAKRKTRQEGALLFHNENDSVSTPPDLYRVLDQEFAFDYDPCPLDCKEDRLQESHPWGKSNYVNPPFSDIESWMARAVKEVEKGNRSVFLVPARTNANYWFEYVWPKASQIRFLKGRVKFGGFKRGLPIPLAVIVYEPGAKNRQVSEFTEGTYTFCSLQLSKFDV